jgi:hypothetical protein
LALLACSPLVHAQTTAAGAVQEKFVPNQVTEYQQLLSLADHRQAGSAAAGR